MSNDVSPQHKGWSHDFERKQYSAQILQPRINGKPNRKFIEVYPQIAKEYFDQGQIDNAMREQI